MPESTIGVAVPSIPVRPNELARALASVCAQTRLPDAISVAMDYGHEGAAVTRNRAWRALGDVDFVAFLDDDDEFEPFHLAVLLASALETGADVTYAWTTVAGGWDPLAINGKPAEGHPFDDEAREWLLNSGNFIPVTTLVRRSALEAVNGFPKPGSARWAHESNEDWGCWQDLLRAGFTFHHVPGVRSWIWHWDLMTPESIGNTSGRPW